MDALSTYTIPLRSLSIGLHQYQWTLGSGFFQHFEASPIRNGLFETQLILDRQEDLSTMELKIKGHYQSVCDRCLASIEIPVEQRHYLFIKNGEETETDPDLIYLPMDQTELKLADVLYDYVCLSLPLRQVVDCENMSHPPCNRDVLDRLQNTGASAPEPSVWDVLKKLNSN